MSLDLSPVGRNNDNTKFTLTPDQDYASGHIIDFIAAPFNPAKYVIGLKGPGGSGKTYTLNYIIRNCIYSNSVIKCCTPTHKACRVLSEALGNRVVETIQSTFGFRLDMRLEDFDPLRPQFNPMAKVKLDNIKLLIIDEASMIPAGVVTYICNKCKELEIKVIFTGDPHQLAPVNESRSIAFLRCFINYELKEIVRQDKSNPITPLLQILRKDIDHRSFKFIEALNRNIGKRHYADGGGFTVLRPAEFKERVDSTFHDERYTKNIDMYRVLGYTNNCIAGWNNYIRNSIIKDAKNHIITKNDLIMSYETIVNEFMESVIDNSEEYIVNDIANFVDPDYGFKGYLVKFQLVHGGMVTIPLFIIDHRDRNSIVYYHKVITELHKTAKMANGGTRVARWKEYYAFKKKYLIAANVVSGDKIIHKRDIDYGFSLTAHKSQGSTYQSVFVDVIDMLYDKNNQPYANADDLLRRLYVACSRPRTELVLCYGK